MGEQVPAAAQAWLAGYRAGLRPGDQCAGQTVTTRAAIQLVARRVLTCAIAGTSPDWENYPDIGEDDWNAVMAEACRLVEQTDPSTADYDTAYEHLAARAEEASDG